MRTLSHPFGRGAAALGADKFDTVLFGHAVSLLIIQAALVGERTEKFVADRAAPSGKIIHGDMPPPKLYLRTHISFRDIGNVNGEHVH